MAKFDITLIGGGIVGAATALELKTRYPRAKILLVEKKKNLASHQTGHNSGVVHAGVYYAPGTLKADFCRQGARDTKNFCAIHNLPFRQCGKLLVATTPLELERMKALKTRCEKNHITTHWVNQYELGRLEPNIVGLGALKVSGTGITDFVKITAKFGELFQQKGGTLCFGNEVTRILETQDSVTLALGRKTVSTRYLIVCGGLNADRLARMMDIDINFMIIPFRGEYYRLPKRLNKIVSHLIYPIPDPDLPFLGVHLTPMIDHGMTVGPNAVMGWKKEGYGKINFSASQSLAMIKFKGFRQVLAANFKSGVKEWIDSAYKPGWFCCKKLLMSDTSPFWH
ncbi:MAG: L-2-hydroxyglutarate oxidase [Desulfobacter sp.]|nr:L-2-hydroxyglutarate oxidase [Desulfobacter sp.]WDP86106.1 MAG: L-2-hydroxyglutarate oxidase [Desulfobacter sp.]